jgi:hypothetical protein
MQVRDSYFTLDTQQIPAGIGSGFIWDKQGTVGEWMVHTDVPKYRVVPCSSSVA